VTPTQPISYQVERDRDGRSYSHGESRPVQQARHFSMGGFLPRPRGQPEMQSDSPLAMLMSRRTRRLRAIPIGFDGFQGAGTALFQSCLATRLWPFATRRYPPRRWRRVRATYLSTCPVAHTLATRVLADTGQPGSRCVVPPIVPLDNWVLLDLVPHRVASGRGWIPAQCGLSTASIVPAWPRRCFSS